MLHVGKERCKTGGMQERSDAEQVRCRTGDRQDWMDTGQEEKMTFNRALNCYSNISLEIFEQLKKA